MYAVGDLGHLGFHPQAITRMNLDDWRTNRPEGQTGAAALRSFMIRSAEIGLPGMVEEMPGAARRMIERGRPCKLVQDGGSNSVELHFKPSSSYTLPLDLTDQLLVICDGLVTSRESDFGPVEFHTPLEATPLMRILVGALLAYSGKHPQWSITTFAIEEDLLINLSIGTMVPEDIDLFAEKIARELDGYVSASRP